MFKRSKSYQRRYNNIIGIDKVSNDVVESTGIDSYKPSKCNSITDTLMCSFGEDEFFNSKDSCNYEDDMDLLQFNSTIENDVAIEDEEEDTTTSEEKNTSLTVIAGLVLGVVITIIINILM